MFARRQHHCGPPSAIHAFYHRDGVPVCKITGQLDMMSAVGYKAKSLFFVERRWHLRIGSVQFQQLRQMSSRARDEWGRTPHGAHPAQPTQESGMSKVCAQ